MGFVNSCETVFNALPFNQPHRAVRVIQRVMSPTACITFFLYCKRITHSSVLSAHHAKYVINIQPILASF